MEERKDGNIGATLEDLRGIDHTGYFLYTNAYESGEGYGSGAITLKSDDMVGIDLVLMNAGYRFIPDMARPDALLFWMERNNESENLRYHPISDFDKSLCQKINPMDIKMRVDFFRLGATSVYDVVKKLLEFGYNAVMPILNGSAISKWIYFIPMHSGYSVNELGD
jgi:hypothetical protein